MHADTQRKILVVDDEFLIAFSLGAYLKKRHFDVTWTASPVEALSYIRERAFDAIVSDIFMSPIDGVALIKELRMRDGNCKVVLMSATIERAKVEKEIAELDVQAFFHKPFDLSEVHDTLKTLTSEASVNRLYEGV